MKNLKLQIQITMALGIVVLLSGILSHLALTDIAHMEPNVSLEWNILRVSAGIFMLFIGAALLTLKRVLGLLPK